MSSFQNTPMQDLIKALRILTNGHIGFDPFRDARTKTKPMLLMHLAAHFTPDAILAALAQVQQENRAIEATSPVTIETPTSSSYDTETRTYSPVVPPVSSDALKTLQEALAGLMPKQALDESRVNQLIGAALVPVAETTRELAQSVIQKALDIFRDEFKAPTVVHVHNTVTHATTHIGVQHKNFPTLLKACQARDISGHGLSIWLAGPAGTGKTTAAHKCADALDLKFYFNGAISTEYQLMGYKDAHGTYHRTGFRDAYELGGVYLFDEIDSSDPRALLAFNAALANGVCAFPDGIIPRHKDCIIIAGANTTGNGGTAEYCGRMKQDFAFLNRFILLEWPLDESLEQALSNNPAWLETVRKVRANIISRSIKNHMITTRAVIHGEALLAAGLTEKQVTDMVLRKGLSDDTWREVKP